MSAENTSADSLSAENKPENGKQDFFDKPENVKRILYGLYASCAILFLLDFVIHRHTYHSWEKLWGFYPIYGFVGCSVLVFVAAWMRTFLMRPEDYYDKEELKSITQTGDSAASDNDGGQHD